MTWIITAVVAVLLLGVGIHAADNAFPPGPESIQQMIRRTANQAGVDPAVMLALCQKESSFVPSASNPSDPSYGLFGIKANWLTYFGYGPDVSQLFNAQTATDVACQIVGYFQDKGFVFPDQADIYNVGETLWAKGRRNIPYRDSVKNFYRSFNV